MRVISAIVNYGGLIFNFITGGIHFMNSKNHLPQHSFQCQKWVGHLLDTQLEPLYQFFCHIWSNLLEKSIFWASQERHFWRSRWWLKNWKWRNNQKWIFFRRFIQIKILYSFSKSLMFSSTDLWIGSPHISSCKFLAVLPTAYFWDFRI